MMKMRLPIAYLLIIVSMVMLTARSLPHHHHWHKFCMAMDQTSQTMSDNADQHPEETECDNWCVTNFRCLQPSSGNEMDAITEYAILSTDFLRTIIDFLLPEKGLSSPFFQYAEPLQQDTGWRSISLRAPPFVC